MNIRQQIKSIRRGQRLEMPYEGTCIPSWRSVAAALNIEAGWTKYSIAVSKPLNIVAVIHNGHKKTT